MGTGQTAGWLGEVPGVERVDVVEIEPAFIEFAELCKDDNVHDDATGFFTKAKGFFKKGD